MSDFRVAVQVVESAPAFKSSVPLYGDDVDHARAVEVGLLNVTSWWPEERWPEERHYSVGIVSIVRTLLNTLPYLEIWPVDAWDKLRDAVDADVQAQVETGRVNLNVVTEVVNGVVYAVRRVLAPARYVGPRYAPVAVLLGSRLQLLRRLVGLSQTRTLQAHRIEALWNDGLTTTSDGDIDVVGLVDSLTPRWCAPTVVQRTNGRDWNPFALRIGETVAWHELDDRSVIEIAAFESYRLTLWRAGFGDLLAPMLMESSRRDLGFALAEARYRGLLLAPDDLRVACDLALSRGALVAGEPERLTLVELWARCLPYAHNR